MTYEIIGSSIYDINDDENFEINLEKHHNEMDSYLSNIFTGKKVIFHVMNNRFSDDHSILFNDIDELIYDGFQMVAVKDGIDLVRFSNGHFGIVAYYNSYKTLCEII